MTYRISDKAHTIYRTKDGTRVPSVTTLTGVMDKPALVKWANNLGLQGIDSTKYVDALATAGTLAHYMVECSVMGEERDPDYMREFSPIDVDRAETSLIKFEEWKAKHTIKLLGHEEELVSEVHKFGGKIDLLLELDGAVTLVDIKTAKALYGPGDDKWAQLAGYWVLCEEAGKCLANAAILRIGREPAEGFEYVEMPNVDAQIRRFFICQDLYKVQQELRKS